MDADLMQHQLRNLQYLNAMALAKLFQQFVIAGTIVAHCVVRTHHKASRMKSIHQISFYKFHVGKLGEVACERDDHSGIHAFRLYQLQVPRKGIDHKEIRMRTKQLLWMGIKRHNGTWSRMFMGIRGQEMQNPAMPQVNTVKGTNGHHRVAQRYGFIKSSKDLHAVPVFCPTSIFD